MEEEVEIPAGISSTSEVVVISVEQRGERMGTHWSWVSVSCCDGCVPSAAVLCIVV